MQTKQPNHFRIITCNANGIRAAEKKGLITWLNEQHADVICIQETKGQSAEIEHAHLVPTGYYSYYHHALKKGYSGVALFCLQKPQRIQTGLGWQHADEEGRYIQADFPNLSIASVYFPSGTSGELRQKVKIDFMHQFAQRKMPEINKQKKPIIIAGDWNIAHQKRDIKNWRGNLKNSGFLPEERAWLDQLFTQDHLTDAFREVNQEEAQYTWWSYRAKAWASNAGWRIDYQMINTAYAHCVKQAMIYKQQRFSDHAPLIIDYQL